MSQEQQTIGGAAELAGRGLHTGEPVVATLRPAPADTGICFRRTDLAGAPVISARVEDVCGVRWETAIEHEGVRVRTVEHVLAALHALRVDNVWIDLTGPEAPALDGSAGPWCDAILEAGLAQQDTEAMTLEVRTPFHLDVGEARYDVLPHDGYRVSGHIDFDHPLIGRQFRSVAVEPEAFTREVAPARTFGFSAWQETLNAEGFALGATLENTIALSPDGIEGDAELRFPDEFVRHKILDIIGDLALVGARLQCHVVAERPSHRGNVQVARQLKTRLAQERGLGMEIQDILRLLPHRYPMLLVDRVLDIEPGKRIVGLKNVSANEPFFAGHFPGHPVMPGVLVLEALAQCGGLLLMQGLDDPADKVVYILTIDDVKFRHPVVPGDQLRLEVEMVQFRGRRGRLKCVARVDGKIATEATVLGQVMDK